MIEINENIPFLWRLSAHNGEGFCVVSMVVPFNQGDQNLEHTIETRVLSFTGDVDDNEEEVLEWNEEDLSLFLKLVASRQRKSPEITDLGETSIRVDLADPETIEIVQIVAAAGFGLALPCEDIVIDSTNVLISPECEVGSHVSINTIEGFKRCVVVDMEEDEVVCVILDKVEASPASMFDEINPYDLLLLKKSQILHPQYTSPAPRKTDILH